MNFHLFSVKFSTSSNLESTLKSVRLQFSENSVDPFVIFSKIQIPIDRPRCENRGNHDDRDARDVNSAERIDTHAGKFV